MSNINTEELTESWVELGGRSNTPLAFVGEEYMRLLREAQREGSSRHSLASSGRASPKSPPNTPNTEPSTEDELRGLAGEYGNHGNKDSELSSAEWVWQWSSRPDQMPPKDWRFRHPSYMSKKNGAVLSLRRARIGGRPLFSADILSTLLLSNILSLILGAGLGVWLSRRTALLSKVTLQ